MCECTRTQSHILHTHSHGGGDDDGPDYSKTDCDSKTDSDSEEMKRQIREKYVSAMECVSVYKSVSA